MPLRKRLFIVISAVLGVILLISLAIYFQSRKKVEPAPTPVKPVVIDQNNFKETVKVGTDPVVVPQNVTVKPMSPAQQDEITVKNLAKIFVERYHTYSSENNYQNIKDVSSITGNTFWKKISAPLSKDAPTSPFTALTTEVVSVLSVDVNGDEASVDVRTRKTSTANGQDTVGYGENVVKLTKTSDGWKVSDEIVK